MFPFTVVPAYNLPVYASQRPLPDATQDSVRGCSLGFAAAVITDGRLQRAYKAQRSSVGSRADAPVWPGVPTHTTSPAPSTSHATCGFPALRAPICFTPKLMGPILLGRLSARRVEETSHNAPQSCITCRESCPTSILPTA